MKFLFSIFCVFGYYFLLSEAGKVRSIEQASLLNSDLGNEIQQASFKCPFPFGAFGDPTDCGKYYICMANKGINRNCKSGHHFDILRRVCLPSIIAICGYKDKRTTEAPTRTTTEGKFKCPSFGGNHPHPTKCNKYYKCTFFFPSKKTCPPFTLFDAVKKSCEPEDTVNCGDRDWPGKTTAEDVTENPNTESTTESGEETTDSGEETTKPGEETADPGEETTRSKDITHDETETPTNPSVTIPEHLTSTGKIRLTSPPETDCDEDDVDCIIDETGDPDDWFMCPEDVGSYPHPSSDKLFIFCMNWIPSVKKCGLNLVFSNDLFTCTEP